MQRSFFCEGARPHEPNESVEINQFVFRDAFQLAETEAYTQ